jgi:hypothetical protein
MIAKLLKPYNYLNEGFYFDRHKAQTLSLRRPEGAHQDDKSKVSQLTKESLLHS